MVKEKIKLIIYFLTILAFIATVVLTLFIMLGFPPVTGLAYQTFLGLIKRDWSKIQFNVFKIFAVLAIISFVLNWNEFKEKIKKTFEKKKHEHHHAQHETHHQEHQQ
ncbi:MAG: hypothetical protein KKF46_07285 [Nanoarchaeota archaeon]|nr:hypothetical protein [Nanoarchaeota archaeon]MBU1322131.1 hypothetical protein [Nanoarchaeota archaeon]MBU1597599.1 hypothetical protein [Nanoarchaeota archaeon]MBU2442091.1 hypothetical protein [Nanoarchaeota archaeon]